MVCGAALTVTREAVVAGGSPCEEWSWDAPHPGSENRKDPSRVFPSVLRRCVATASRSKFRLAWFLGHSHPHPVESPLVCSPAGAHLGHALSRSFLTLMANEQRPGAPPWRSSALRLKRDSTSCTVISIPGFWSELFFGRENTIRWGPSFDSHAPCFYPVWVH